MEYKLVKVMWQESQTFNHNVPFEELMLLVNNELQKAGAKCLGGPTFTTVEGEYGTKYGWLIQAMLVPK